ncbi:MAG: acyl carrier protein [Deltaproteobacteria bacterium]|jgi:acyl carrier protein|nr:acyl carrier protein [Deltaproteobacteria bacterium]
MTKARKIISETFRLSYDHIVDDLTVEKVVAWDSSDRMELVTNLGTGLGVKFDGREIEKMTSEGAIIKLIEAKLG